MTVAAVIVALLTGIALGAVLTVAALWRWLRDMKTWNSGEYE